MPVYRGAWGPAAAAACWSHPTPRNLVLLATGKMVGQRREDGRMTSGAMRRNATGASDGF